MNAPAMVRVDKWLWAVRVFKTRSQATAACRGGRVKIAGQNLKPSHEVHPGETLIAQMGTYTKTVRVLGLIDQRVGAAVAKDYMEDLTPASEYQRQREEALRPVFYRPKGSGRPTKKDRRALEGLGF